MAHGLSYILSMPCTSLRCTEGAHVRQRACASGSGAAAAAPCPTRSQLQYKLLLGRHARMMRVTVLVEAPRNRLH